jgi:hypothetical protein
MNTITPGCTQPGRRPPSPTPTPSPSPSPTRSLADDEPQSCDKLAVVRFSEHLCAKLEADTKRITLRSRHRSQIRPGQWVQLVCMDSRRRFLARITRVRHTTWRGITDQELTDDGFSGREQLLPIMRRYYPGIAADDPATVYRWDRSRPCARVRE